MFLRLYSDKDLKIISKLKRADVLFHAQRCIQELSYDTLRSVKDWEVEIPDSLLLVMPIDFVNYVKLAWSDSTGTERIIYPSSKRNS